MDPKCYLALVGSLCCVNLFDMSIQVVGSGRKKGNKKLMYVNPICDYVYFYVVSICVLSFLKEHFLPLKANQKSPTNQVL